MENPTHCRPRQQESQPLLFLAGLTARNKYSSSSASLSTFQKASEVLYLDGVRVPSQSSPATKPPSITSLTPDGAELLLADGRPSGKEKLK